MKPNTEQHFDFECRCGEKIEIKVEVKDAGFRSASDANEEFEYIMDFGRLVITGGMKE